jgi:hypothetical protein
MLWLKPLSTLSIVGDNFLSELCSRNFPFSAFHPSKMTMVAIPGRSGFVGAAKQLLRVCSEVPKHSSG